MTDPKRPPAQQRPTGATPEKLPEAGGSQADDDADLRRSDLNDIADRAQEEMPGPPPHVPIGNDDPLDEERRREFERLVAERERNEKTKR